MMQQKMNWTFSIALPFQQYFCYVNLSAGLSNSKVSNLESQIESQMHKKDSTFKMNLKV